MLDLVASGANSRTIAAALDISLHTVHKHRSNICQKLQLHSYASMAAYAASRLTPRPPARKSVLTAAQQRVVALLAQGLSGKQVARQLGVSPATIQAHRCSAMRRLGARNLPHMLAMLSAVD